MATVNENVGTNVSFDLDKVQLLERLVAALFSGAPQEREFAHNQLNQLKADTESWRIVGSILELSKDFNTRFFALSILEECISQRWNILEEDQKSGIKQFIIDLAIKTSVEPNISDSKFFLTKVNSVFIQVVKREWPQNWPTFIPDICAAAKSNPAFFENCLKILSLLSEEVFDFGQTNLTTSKAYQLMSSLNEQFQQINDLCMFSMQTYSQNTSLMVTTLQCLTNYLKWIPCAYIFETELINYLMTYFWDSPSYRIYVVRALIEITALKDIPPQFLEKLGMSLWVPLTNKISHLSDSTLNYGSAKVKQSTLFWENFYLPLSICLTNFLRNFRCTVCEVYPNPITGVKLTTSTLQFLAKMTSIITHEETFKICLDYWNQLSEILFKEVYENYKLKNGNRIANLTMETIAGDDESDLVIEDPENYSDKLSIYQPVLTDVRKALISRMAKPREVCIHYDEETGTVDRDYEIDTDEVALYNIMRETLIYLTNLGNCQMQEVVVESLNNVANEAKKNGGTDWNPVVLCRLCWAIGSISGSLSINREKSLVIFVIQRLFWLCEHKRGIKNKSIIASVIMYIFGQYPRFLNRHIKFLVTVIEKLFEFMYEEFEGVKEMACETFLKVATKCAKSIATYVLDNGLPLVHYIILRIHPLYTQLKVPSKQLTLFVGLGYIIAAVEGLGKEAQIENLDKLCSSFNIEWMEVMVEHVNSALKGCPNKLYTLQVARQISEILRIYDRLAYTTGTTFTDTFIRIHVDLINCYKLYSGYIFQRVVDEGFNVIAHTDIKAFRFVKRASLLLIQSYVTGSTDTNQPNLCTIKTEIAQYIIPTFLEPILSDYQTSIPQLREFEVLKLLTTLVNVLSRELLNEIPKIFSYIFGCTLDMIKSDFHSYLDHRVNFYEFLEACTNHCFDTLFLLPETTQNLFVESLLWAIKHEQPAVAEQGLKIMHILLKNISGTPELLIPFYIVSYWKIIQTVILVMTDTFHKSGSQYQALILMQLIQIVNLGKLNSMDENAITKEKVMKFLADLLFKTFPNLNEKQIEAFVLQLFNKSGNPKEFSLHLRDFIIQLKEFSGSSDLFETERLEALKEAEKQKNLHLSLVPGMVPQFTAAEFAKLEDFE